MNMFKSNGGFTLVELIIVIAILAILAGVAVPAYSGYINSSKKAADIPSLDAIKTACQAALATEGTTIDSITVEAADGVISTITVNDGEDDEVILYGTGADTTTANSPADLFDNYITVGNIELGYYEDGATWEENATSGEFEWTANE